MEKHAAQLEMEAKYEKQIQAVRNAMQFALDDYAKRHSGAYPVFSADRGEAGYQVSQFIDGINMDNPGFRDSIVKQNMPTNKIYDITMELIAEKSAPAN